MSETVKDGGPAFPSTHDRAPSYVGMSLRDWLAGQVLATACALPNGDENMRHYAKTAYAMADAMLAARDGGRS